ncbi:MAG: tetratricopeptide repeat protein [Gammaproteobacteria bacterium]|nr:tetratricopeptide repeat protein [Gammaproteobacteria bacterium]MBU1553304.1 tetratricopeptide repeat protein [Gammaproteobacteria bacterium]MBU2070848.1 tetratricopeptide repeat protein [Gammaproteobacteria bacterium]MBU2182839.1 tetratricopeptide repeat protein [Gammaproteobacteria bacterium]MBU2203606.1 tetratricopeptide repeat protein [Gammaproteobacteria bacterium]
MSVLNKMLRDLEQRQHSGGVAAPQADSLSRDDSRPLWLNLLLLLSAILLLFAVYAILNRPDNQPQPVVADTQTQANTEQPLALAESELTPVAALPVTPAGDALVATPDISPGSAEPGPELAMAQQPLPAQTDSTEEAAPAADTVEADTSNPVAAPAANRAAAVKIEVQRTAQTAAQKGAALQQQAVQAAQSGQLMPAINLWQQVQAVQPLQATAYLSQARLWLQMGQPQRAEQILQQGISAGADTADVRLLLAQLYAQQQQWQAADTVLPVQFELQQYPEYYGLKATVAQQLGDSFAAQQWFGQLIVIQPQQARWWLGAAVAFDQQGQRQQAQLHYRQALQWGDKLSAESRNYIQQRLAATE